jgi:hypothetical protein
MKRIAALSAALVVSAVSSASASYDCRNIQFHDFAQPVIYCPATMLCEIVMGQEQIHRAFSSQSAQWGITPDSVVTDPASGRLSLILKPETDGLTANFRVFTSKHVFRFIAKSTPPDSSTVCTSRFLFEDEKRAFAKMNAPKPRVMPAQFWPPPPGPTPAPRPLTSRERLQRKLDVADAYTKAQGDRYSVDVQVPDYRIIRAAHTPDHTLIQFEHLTRTPASVPQIMDTGGASRAVENRYDYDLRVYVIDNVSSEYTLTVPAPTKKDKSATVAVHVRRERLQVASGR